MKARLGRPVSTGSSKGPTIAFRMSLRERAELEARGTLVGLSASRIAQAMVRKVLRGEWHDNRRHRQ